MKMVGIFFEHELLNAIARRAAAVLSCPVSEFMTAPVMTCRPADRINSVLGLMTLRRIRHLPVNVLLEISRRRA